MVGALLRHFINFVLPPRRTERIVESLRLEDLYRLQRQDGLPYHAPEVAALVWELKYYKNGRAAALAGELLAEELLAIASEELGAPLLIPVPMHAARRRERGHNQTEVLCEAALHHLTPPPFPAKKSSDLPYRVKTLSGQTLFADKGGSAAYEYLPSALERAVSTPQQQGLERSKRLHNVKNSMRAAEPEKIKGRVCVVVDDVSTTGATLAEATRALMAAGADRVHSVALAQS